MSITGELEAIWSDYDLDELASDGAKFLSRGSSTDWGLPADIEPKVWRRIFCNFDRNLMRNKLF